VSGLTYDTGALVAAEANDRRMWAVHARAIARSHVPTIPAGVLAQAWRGGPQPLLARLVVGCDIDPLDETGARIVGAALARSGTDDVVDASVVVGALRRGDSVVTSDRDDVTHLAQSVGRRVNIVGI
jgi:hypothetical protein